MQVVAWILTLSLMAFWSILCWLLHNAVIFSVKMPWYAVLEQLAYMPGPSLLAPFQPLLVSLYSPLLFSLVGWMGATAAAFHSAVLMAWVIGFIALIFFGFMLNGAVINWRRNHGGGHHDW